MSPRVSRKRQSAAEHPRHTVALTAQTAGRAGTLSLSRTGRPPCPDAETGARWWTAPPEAAPRAGARQPGAPGPARRATSVLCRDDGDEPRNVIAASRRCYAPGYAATRSSCPQFGGPVSRDRATRGVRSGRESPGPPVWWSERSRECLETSHSPAECTTLLRWSPLSGTEGSNPSVSALRQVVESPRIGFTNEWAVSPA